MQRLLQYEHDVMAMQQAYMSLQQEAGRLEEEMRREMRNKLEDRGRQSWLLMRRRSLWVRHRVHRLRRRLQRRGC